MGEHVIEIDFIDCPGLGYEIFKCTEQHNIDKIAMEVLPKCGMVIKFRAASQAQAEKVLLALQKIPGVKTVQFREQMPYEERECELKTILDSVSEGILAVDKEGRITHINDVACRLFGCSPQDMIGKPAEVLLEPKPPILETLKTGRSLNLQERRIKRAGKSIHFLTSCVPVRNSNGQVIGAVSTIKDFAQVENILAHVDKMRKRIGFADIVYQSLQMQEVIQSAQIVTKSNSTVLLRGESGTGKELFAAAIHTEGPRYRAPFIAVNCTALPDALLESELFGYEEGAFTGALKGGKKGLFEQADGGTLFLDEIGEISTQVQVRLLRALQSGTIRRIGGDKEIQVDVRIIAATHRNLEEMMKQGAFREDLYYRLNVIPLTIPPLRERTEDIPLIAQRLIRKICAKLEQPERHLRKDSMELLTAQQWPGNVRQLENTLERVINLTDAMEITPRHLALWGDIKAADSLRPQKENCIISIPHPPDDAWPKLKDLVAIVEKAVITKVLEKYPSSRAAGQVLGVSNTTVLNKVHAYGIEQPDKIL